MGVGQAPVLRSATGVAAFASGPGVGSDHRVAPARDAARPLGDHPGLDPADEAGDVGLDLATGPAELRRAVLEGIAMRAAELVGAMRARLGSVSRVAVDGGLVRSAFFRGFLVDALGQAIEVAASPDMTALGTLHLCLAAIGSAERPGAGERSRVEPRAPLPSGLHARYARAVALSRAWGRGG